MLVRTICLCTHSLLWWSCVASGYRVTYFGLDWYKPHFVLCRSAQSTNDPRLFSSYNGHKWLFIIKNILNRFSYDQRCVAWSQQVARCRVLAGHWSPVFVRGFGIVFSKDRSWLVHVQRLRVASHYMILSLRRPAMAPHDAIADRTSCSVRPAILSAATLTIGWYRRPS